MERYFKFSERGTDLKTGLLSGAATFLTMKTVRDIDWDKFEVALPAFLLSSSLSYWPRSNI